MKIWIKTMFEHCKTWSFLSDPTADLNLMPILFNHQKLIGSILIIRLTATCLGIIKLSNNINNTLDIFLFSPISVSTSHARITYGSQCEPCSWICAIWTPYYGALGWVASEWEGFKPAVDIHHPPLLPSSVANIPETLNSFCDILSD